MILPEVIADLESAHKALHAIVDAMEDDYRRRKIEAAQRKILVSIDTLRRMTPGDFGPGGYTTADGERWRFLPR